MKMKLNSIGFRIAVKAMLLTVLPLLMAGWVVRGMLIEKIRADQINTVGEVADDKHQNLTALLAMAHLRAEAFLSNLQAQCAAKARGLDESCSARLLESHLAAEKAEGVTLYRQGVRQLSIGPGAVRDVSSIHFQAGQLAHFHGIGPLDNRSYTILADEASSGLRLAVTYPSSNLVPLFEHPPKVLGASGETFLADSSGYFVTTAKYPSKQGHDHPIHTRPMRSCLSGNSGELLDLDYRDMPIIHGFRFVPELGAACIMAHIDQAEAFAPLAKLEKKLALYGLLLMLAALALAWFTARRITKPVSELTGAVRDYAEGNRSVRLAVPGNDEIAELSSSFNAMADKLNAAELERKEIEDSLRLSSLVLKNSSEGLLVTDEHNLIVAVNPAFTRITGYSFEEVRGKNPRILSSGRQDKAYYQAMWQELNTTGQWQGEIWDRRKNGEIHAKRLTINTIRNEGGGVFCHVALFSDITEKKQSEELIWRQANFDMLTGLPNRRMFHDRLEQETMKSDRTGLPLALLLIDLDEFKEVNDTLGHDMGDMLLKQAALRIVDRVRASDTVARLGGDEFTVVLSQLADVSHAEDCAQKIIAGLAEPFHLGSEVVYVSASIGITLYPNDATDIESLMKNADQAMYVAKNQGRNRFSYFTPALQEAAQKRMRLANDLRGALTASQFQVYYQPIVELATGGIRKAEALIRWRHPERGMVSPAEFIPLAEETGLIVEIGYWVFMEAARQADCWKTLFDEAFQISVNRSPVQFREHVEQNHLPCIRYLDELQLPGKSIVFEITEGLLLDAAPGVTYTLLKFRDAGIQVSLDDFGTGYSSLSYLKKFDIDYLKIDRSFVEHLETDASNMALCEAIIVMAHKLGLKVVAEGVETEGQRRFLASAGCDYGQGYLFSRPVPPEEFEKLLADGSLTVEAKGGLS